MLADCGEGPGKARFDPVSATICQARPAATGNATAQIWRTKAASVQLFAQVNSADAVAEQAELNFDIHKYGPA